MNFLRFNRSDVWYSLLLVGIAATLASFVAAILAIRLMYTDGDWQNWWAMLPPDYKPLPLFAGMASAVLGPAFWWWIIIKPGRLSVRRGILVGALVGIVAHPVVLYAAFVSAYFAGHQTVMSFQVTNPLRDLVTAIVVAVFSVIIAGWLTALIGGVFGGVIALLQSVSGCRGRWRAALSS
jgi:phosphotransferase system  glucose/maltose/N-acetylglucosamine-specific IIC component